MALNRPCECARRDRGSDGNAWSIPTLDLLRPSFALDEAVLFYDRGLFAWYQVVQAGELAAKEAWVCPRDASPVTSAGRTSELVHHFVHQKHVLWNKKIK